jgi:holo-[acyl-carrier protein] synthase
MSEKPYSLGIDIIEVDRIEHSIRRFGDRFLRKVFTPREIAYCRTKPRPAQHYAARFAAKEAVYKAAKGAEKLWFTQIEIIKITGGSPDVELIGAKSLRSDEFSISISHTHTYATAVAIRMNRR